MATKSTPVVTNYDTRTFIQSDGVGTKFDLYDCQALTEWTRGRTDTLRVRVKSANTYGEFTTKATQIGRKEYPTFTVMAYTPQELDWLLDIDCPTDFWLMFGQCNSPSDVTGYSKIRHFYRATNTEEGESATDFIGEEDPAGIEQSTSWSAEDVVTIVQVQSEEKRTGVT